MHSSTLYILPYPLFDCSLHEYDLSTYYSEVPFCLHQLLQKHCRVRTSGFTYTDALKAHACNIIIGMDILTHNVMHDTYPLVEVTTMLRDFFGSGGDKSSLSF